MHGVALDMRIVSLLPSATEIVFAVGLGDDLVGVTHECDWPPEARAKPVMTRSTHDLSDMPSGEIHRLVSDSIHGGSSIYELDESALAEAAPDVILTQELCAVCAVSYERVNDAVRAIDADTNVVSLEPTSIEGIFNTITTVGAMTEAEDAAIALVEKLRSRLGAVERKVQQRRAKGHEPVRAVALEWLDPPFAVGHWVPEQIRRSGGWDLLGREASARSRPRGGPFVTSTRTCSCSCRAATTLTRPSPSGSARPSRFNGARSRRSGAARSSPSTDLRTTPDPDRG